MSNQIYPTLPGIKMDMTRRPVWKTQIKESVSGMEVRASSMAYPIWEFVLQYDFLRSATALVELQTLVGFFNQMRGAFDDFLWAVPEDSSVTNYQFGVGNGATVNFQLTKAFGGFVEPVYNLNGAPTIKINDVTKSTPADYTISSTGLVSFTSAPAAAATLKWSGGFYQRVRFMKDQADFERFMYQLWQLKKIELRGVKGS